MILLINSTQIAQLAWNSASTHMQVVKSYTVARITFLSLSTVNECGECGSTVRVRGKCRGGAVSLGLMAASVSIPITKAAILLLHILCIQEASCGLQRGGLIFKALENILIFMPSFHSEMVILGLPYECAVLYIHRSLDTLLTFTAFACLRLCARLAPWQHGS